MKNFFKWFKRDKDGQVIVDDLALVNEDSQDNGDVSSS